MSRASMEVFTPDGERVGWGIWHGASSIGGIHIEPDAEHAFEREAGVDGRERADRCDESPAGHTNEPGVIYAHYGGGFWWEAAICRTCMTITGNTGFCHDGSGDYDDHPVKHDGHPFARSDKVADLLNRFDQPPRLIYQGRESEKGGPGEWVEAFRIPVREGVFVIEPTECAPYPHYGLSVRFEAHTAGLPPELARALTSGTLTERDREITLEDGRTLAAAIADGPSQAESWAADHVRSALRRLDELGDVDGIGDVIDDLALALSALWPSVCSAHPVRVEGCPRCYPTSSC